MADVDMESGSDDSGMTDLDEEIEKVKEEVRNLSLFKFQVSIFS